jgi:hypothetical protein
MKVNDKKLIKDLRLLNKPLFTMAADRIEELSQENAALKEKIALQPMDNIPIGKNFFVLTKPKGILIPKFFQVSVSFEGLLHVCYFTQKIFIIKKEDCQGWTPLPEGTEGL